MQGIRIVEMSVAVTGPLAVAMLVDQGAEAIKIEPPASGDQGRYLGVVGGSVSSLFQVCNRGKRSVALDCRDPRGRKAIFELCADADVFVQNMRPGVIDRLGLGYEVVSEQNPGIVYASLSGFGPDGPYSHRRVYDSVIQAESGLVASQTSIRDVRPRFLRQAICDKVTAYTAAQAITAALFARERGASGQHIELSMLDASVAFLFADSAAHEIVPDNNQRHLPQSFLARQKAIAFADGHAVVAAVTDAEFHGMARAFDVDTSDPRVATIADRARNRDQARQIFRDVHAAAAKMPITEAVKRLDDNRVPFGVVSDVSEVANDAQVQHNELFFEHEHPDLGRVRQPRPPARFSETPTAWSEPSAPALGQHTAEVLAEIGWADRIGELRADGVIR